MFAETSSGSSSSIPNLNVILLFLYVSKLHSTTGPSGEPSILFNWILGSLSFFPVFAAPLPSFFSEDNVGAGTKVTFVELWLPQEGNPADPIDVTSFIEGTTEDIDDRDDAFET